MTATKMDAAQLQEVFEFNDEDLSLNRSGTLSTKQKEMLEEARKLRGCGRRAALIGLGGTTALYTLLFAYLLISGTLNSLTAIIGSGAMLALFVIVFVVALVMDYVRGQDLKTGRISTVEGVASKHKVKKVSGQYGHKHEEYYVRVGGRRIRLQGPQQLDTLHSEDTFRLYIIKNPPVDIVLSVEVV